MSDPAEVAAQRAWDSDQLSTWPSQNAVAGARAALEPLRELHRPVKDSIGLTICAQCSCGAHGRMWPCCTARLIYSAEELANV